MFQEVENNIFGGQDKMGKMEKLLLSKHPTDMKKILKN